MSALLGGLVNMGAKASQRAAIDHLVDSGMTEAEAAGYIMSQKPENARREYPGAQFSLGDIGQSIKSLTQRVTGAGSTSEPPKTPFPKPEPRSFITRSGEGPLPGVVTSGGPPRPKSKPPAPKRSNRQPREETNHDWPSIAGSPGGGFRSPEEAARAGYF